MNDTLIFVNHDSLKRHPHNMRRAYPVRDVRQMAVSQMERTRRGEPACVQPLVVTVGPGLAYDPDTHHQFIIVAGHMRHAGNASLKGNAPPLNCLVRYYATEADMLADMGTENGLRADPGPLAWATYLRDQLASGVKLHVVMQRSGLSLGRVRLLQSLLTLAPPVQQHFDAGALPMGSVKALASVEDAVAQVELARELAGRRATLAQVELAVKAWLARTSGQPITRAKPGRKPGTPVPATPDAPAIAGVPQKLPATARQVRAAARIACHDCGCDKYLDEPAWSIAIAAAEQTCRVCDLAGFEVVCKSCPLAQAMREVVVQVRGEKKSEKGVEVMA